MEPVEKIKHLGDRTQGLIFGVPVLIDDKVVGTLHAAFHSRGMTQLSNMPRIIDCIQNSG